MSGFPYWTTARATKLAIRFDGMSVINSYALNVKRYASALSLSLVILRLIDVMIGLSRYSCQNKVIDRGTHI